MLELLHIENIAVIESADISFRPGFNALTGETGAGKTTTLKSVAGILQFDTGEIYIDGKSIRTQPLECKRSFAYIPDNPDLYDYMTGIKYLNFISE